VFGRVGSIKPKTDPAFLYALIHVMLHESARERLDLEFLEQHTNSPYLVGANGFFLRDSGDAQTPAMGYEAQCGGDIMTRPAAIRPSKAASPATRSEIGPDEAVLAQGRLDGSPSFAKLVEHVQPYSPEWAADICDVPAATMRRIANEFLDHAQVGATVEIEGKTRPYRPVSVSLGKTVNNGWGGFECVWAAHPASQLVGGLEVPGGHSGHYRAASIVPCPARLEEREAGTGRIHALPDEPDPTASTGAAA